MSADLLTYARDREELGAMCAGIARSLRPGARFVTVNGNPALRFPDAPSYRRYGFETSVPGPWREGAPITWKFHLDDGCFELENYHLDVAIHEEALHRAGFRTVLWHAPRLAPEGTQAHGAGFWSTLPSTRP